MEKSVVWFSHKENKYDAELKLFQKYFYWTNESQDQIFINTANHAMSFHDANHKIWKWEYIPWEEDSAIVYGEKPRNKVDRYIWPR